MRSLCGRPPLMTRLSLSRRAARASRIRFLATPSTRGGGSPSSRLEPVENDRRANDECGIQDESGDRDELAHDAGSTISSARAELATASLDTPLRGPRGGRGCTRASFSQERESASPQPPSSFSQKCVIRPFAGISPDDMKKRVITVTERASTRPNKAASLTPLRRRHASG